MLRALRGKVRALLRWTTFRLAPTRAYLRLYARDTDRRVDQAPHRASGHPEEVVAPLVLRYVRHLGLEPQHRFLDFGCGTLRTGKHLIHHLEEGRYVGVDISRGAVNYSLGLIEADPRLASKRPDVRLVEPLQPLDLPWVPDFILCHSVFTHLPRRAAEGTFRQLREVMGPSTTLAFTVFSGEAYSHPKYKDIRYPLTEVVRMARTAGLAVEVLEGEWGMRQTVFRGRLIGNPLRG